MRQPRDLTPARGFPDAARPIVAACRQVAPVRTPCNRAHGASVRQMRHLLTSADRPDPGVAVVLGGGQVLPVRAVGDRLHSRCVGQAEQWPTE